MAFLEVTHADSTVLSRRVFEVKWLNTGFPVRRQRPHSALNAQMT